MRDFPLNDMEKSRYVWQSDCNETPPEKSFLRYGTQRARDQSNIRKGRHSRRLDLVILVVAAVMIRGSDLKEPPFAVYEESKVAGNINRYYDGSFFLSDEPPLATLLYYLLTRMIGFKGSGQYFEPNQTFVGTGFPFYFLRCASVGLGVAEIALTYSTLNRLRLSRATTLLGSLMLLFENTYVTQHRYFFTQAWILFVALVNVSFWLPSEQSEKRMNEFGWGWWRFVLSTSLCCAFAGALSSTGFYAILIGLICSTWTLLQRLGTPKYPVGRAVFAWVVHWSIAALFVIGLYIGCILAHLIMTPNSGTHDILMSGQFQAHLNGSINDLQPLTVRYGSLVTLRHGKTNAYLHSHEALYPKGSGQQQISLYRYRDGNNVWMIEPSDVDLLEELTGIAENSTFLGKTADQGDENQENASRATVSGDFDEKQKLLSSLLASVSSVLSTSSAKPKSESSKPVRSTSDAPVPKPKAKKSTFGKPVAEPIRLRHMNTQRRLHSHEIAPPVSPDEFQKEVSAYGEAGCVGDSNDVWIVEAYNDDTSHDAQPWMVLRTMVRLRHSNLGCYLFGHDVQLPEWGQNQLEVTCSTQGKVENSFWYVESNYHPMVANGTLHEEYIAYPPLSLLEKFTEYVDAMHDAAEVLSAPQHWMSPAYHLPFLPDAVPLYQNHHRQVRLMGNPCIWALGVMGLVGYFAVATIQRFGSQRMFDPFPGWSRYEPAATLSFIAWVVYYMPSFGSRAVDISDYLPALWSSMLVFVIVWEYLVRIRLGMPRVHTVSCILLLMLCMVLFRGLWPLAYATEWTPEICVKRERSWFLDCDLYLNSTTAYREYDSDNYVHFMEVIPRTGWK